MLEKLETELKLRGFTDKTLKAYIFHNKAFLNYIKKKPEQITQENIKSYIAYIMSEKNYKAASTNLAISALRFYYEEILKNKFFTDIKPPKIEKKIPMALTKEEVKKLINSIENPKHRLLVELMYASGLRVSEAVSIKIDDLSLEEGLGTIREGKGKKDRHIIISQSLIPKIKDYVANRKNESEYLFSGWNGHMSTRMAQKIVTDAGEKAGIKKRVYCHILRSSFATHLLENNVDIRKIQVLLGHSSISTTERYTKISTKQLKEIQSPLDSL
ncbi:MAG: tyrosine-type recombinase/integrase [Nanoarchaeota archaeon]|nr:tyrosine-type recombinase/integrase [Nanoarchaeota archaeon]